jgi:hypothetical protein
VVPTKFFFTGNCPLEQHKKRKKKKEEEEEGQEGQEGQGQEEEIFVRFT